MTTGRINQIAFTVENLEKTNAFSLSLSQHREPGDNAPNRADPSNPALCSILRLPSPKRNRRRGDETRANFRLPVPAHRESGTSARHVELPYNGNAFERKFPRPMATRYGTTHRAFHCSPNHTQSRAGEPC